MDLPTLLRKRGQIKARLTTFKGFIENLKVLIPQEPDQSLSESQISQLEARMQAFEQVLSQFEDLHGEILALEHEDNIDKRYNEFCDFEAAYFETLSDARLLFKVHSKNAPHIHALDNSHDNRNSIPPYNVDECHSPVLNENSAYPNCSSNKNPNNIVKLPVLQMKTYNGEPEQFLGFFEGFKSLVHSNPQLDDVSKFLYLKSVLGPEPSKVIQSLDVIGPNYHVALQLIEKRYRNNSLLIHSHIKGLIEFPKIFKESASSLRHMSDSFQAHLRALESLGEPTNSWTSIIAYLISGKLDYNSRKELETIISKDKPYKLPVFIDFLEDRAKLLEKLERRTPRPPAPLQERSRFPSQTYISNDHIGNCVLCGDNHRLYSCRKFISSTVQQRIEIIKRHKLCQNCLQPGHSVSNCRGGRCKKCSSFHSTLLHIDSRVSSRQAPNVPVAETTDTQAVEAATATLTSYISSPKRYIGILPTAVIFVHDIHGIPHKCVALLDSGSMRSYMTTSLCSKLKLETTKVNIPVTGINQTRTSINEITRCQILSRYGDFKATLPFLLLQNITSPLPSSSVDPEQLKISSSISLANPDFYRKTKIDLLLGIDIFWQLISANQPYLHKQPYLVNTHFGYIVSGRLPTHISDDSFNSCHLSIMDLSRQLSRFWEIEDINISKPLSPEERQCELHFQKTTQRDHAGRFVVSIPLSTSPHALGESKQNALRQFYALEKRFLSNRKFKDMYIEFMREYEELGHMRKVNEYTDSLPFEYYIPHHGVYKADSLTTKLRVVFNSSCATSNGTSLNDIQLNGPALQEDLFSILVRFRRFKYIITADCSKMYRSVLIEESQRRLQRIFWRSHPSLPIQIYELCTVTYGEKSSSFLAIRCLFELANLCSKDHPKISDIIKRDMYCDDLLTSCKDEIEASYVCHNISRILRSGGFILRKWNSNHPEVLKPIHSQEISNNILEFGPTENSKTLGLLYNSYSDTLFYNISESRLDQRFLTKRKALSFISTIFDPLGLLSPCTIKAKLFMQQLWLTRTGWDEVLPLELQSQWQSYSSDLPLLNSIRINRQVICDSPKTLEIHAFADSSQRAYGTCIYLRSIDKKGIITVQLLCSKTKVAPLKAVTVPKLELCAIVMMCKLTSKIKSFIELPIADTIYWSDSQIAISWVGTQQHPSDPFVANRVSQIQSHCGSIIINYIGTKDNPADILTRGVSPQNLSSSTLWWNGPSFLSKNSYERPIFHSNHSSNSNNNITSIDNSHQCSFIAVHSFEPFFPFEKYSKLHKIERIMAYCLRFINNCRTSFDKRCTFPLTSEELQSSQTTLAKLSQKECFSKEIALISKNQSLPKGNKVSALTPFINTEDGTLRACGRLINSSFNYDKKHPIILFAKHHFTKLLLEAEHHRLLHAGPKQTLSSIRERYWPVGGQNLIKQIVRNCIPCFRVRPRDIQNLLGHLPLDRVKARPPFTVVGTDYCGPFAIKDRKGRGAKISKCYVCLFVCFSTKAIHLEPVTDLTSEAFILCLRRFASRRGMPSKFYSDNGRTYCGAKSELEELGNFLIKNKNKLQESFSNEKFNWVFLPPYSPNIGGIWEAGIKASKSHLKRVVGNATLTYEHLYTVLVQIEGILNSRPLTPLSDHPNDYLPLTPSHFLTGKAITSVPDPSTQHIPENRLSLYQRLQQITQNFWTRWSKEYISELQCRSKWKIQSPNIKLNSLVLLKDDNLPPLKWRLGRITQTHQGSDGLIRVVTINTASGVTKRAISKVCPLPIDT